jgi:antitoxin component of RelBE/YafQ-DinJ toxin-antitoxin module
MVPGANKKHRKSYVITVRVALEDKRRFDDLTAADGLSSAGVLRKFIKSVLREELSLADIFKKIGYDFFEREKTTGKKTEIKTRLDEQEKQNFLKLCQELDLMPGTLVRILVKYIAANNSLSMKNPNHF